MMAMMDHNERGFVLITTLVVMLILSILGFIFLELAVMKTSMSQGEGEVIKAFYKAEAGLEYAYYRLLDRWDSLDSYQTYKTPLMHESDYGEFNTSDIEIKVEIIDEATKILWSKGKYINTQRTLLTTAKKAFLFAQEFPQLEKLLDYVIYAYSITLDSNAMDVSGKISYYEEFFYTEDIEFSKEDVIKQDEGYIEEVLKYPKIADIAQISSIKDNSYVSVITGDYILDNVPSDFFLLICLKDNDGNGEVIIEEKALSKAADKTVMVLAEGKILVEGDNNYPKDSQGAVILYSESTQIGIEFIDNDIVFNGNLFAPKGKVKSSANSDIIINNKNVNYSSIYQVILEDFQYHIRR